jgi:hyperosmotically inducible periplasmic protein
MKPRLYIAALVAVAALGCSRGSETEAEPATDPEAVAAPGVPADNTDKNERDRKSATLTPVDQSESEADRTITQQIRQGIVGTDEASFAAKNVKVITVEGVVTLRGPVETAAEKTKIVALAKNVDGVKRVDNQLEVASK